MKNRHTSPTASARTGVAPRSLTYLPFVLAALGGAPLAQARLESAEPADSASEPWRLLAWGDVDGDGDADAFATDGQGADKLLENLGDGTLVDASASRLATPGRSSAALFVDVDGDDAPELFTLAADGRFRLLMSLGGVLEDVTDAAGLRLDVPAVDVHWLDWDGDERPDLHVATASGDRLWRNLGALRFEPVVLPAGPATPAPGGGTTPVLVAGTDLPAAVPPLSFGDDGEPAHASAGAPGSHGSSPSTRRPVPSLRRSGGISPDDAKVNDTGSLYGVLERADAGQVGTNAMAGNCATSLFDTATNGCMQASSTPELGKLYPLGNDFFVAASGNVGIGTTNPGSRLQIGDFFVDDEDVHIEMRTIGGGGNEFKQGLKLRSSNPFFGFDLEHDDALKGLNVRRYDLDSGAMGESAFFIDRLTGYVGVGNTAPTEPFQLTTASESSGFTHDDGDVLLGTFITDGSDCRQGGYIGTFSNHPFSIFSGGLCPRLIVDENGHVGIGNETPDIDFALDIEDVGQGSSWTGAIAAGSSTGNKVVLGELNGIATIGGHNGDLDAWRDIIIAPTGRVGIGNVTAPTANLHVSSLANAVLRLEADTNNAGESDHARVEFSQDGGLESARVGFAGGTNEFQVMATGDVGHLVLGADDTEHVRVLRNGNVGIGTTQPSEQLELGSNSTSGDRYIAVRTAGGNQYKAGVKFSHFADTNGFVIESDETGPVNGLNITRQAGGVSESALFIHRVIGNVGIGTTSPTQRLSVNGSAGKPGGGSWSTFSDARLKQNVAELEGALETLLALRGVTFEYIDPASINELAGERVGFIAQEVERVLPDWVDSTGEYKSLTIRGFEALAVEALRELSEENQELARANRELEERIARLEAVETELAELTAAVSALMQER